MMGRTTTTFRWRVGLLLVLSATSPGAARADEFQVGRPISAEAVFARCPTGRGVETALCLDRQVTTLRALLKASVARHLADIAKVASETPGPGMLGGAAAAEAWKRDFLSAQASWQAYDTRQCRNLADYDFYGGSAASQFVPACAIRHLVARVNELAEP